MSPGPVAGPTAGPAAGPPEAPPRAGLARLLLPRDADPAAAPLLVARSMRAFADGYMALLLPAYLLAIGLGALEVGIVSTATMLGSALATLAVGAFGHRFAARRLLRGAALLMAATGVGFAGITSFWPLLVVAFIGTLNPSSGDVSVFVPLEHARLAHAARGSARVALFARYSVMGALFAALGALAAALPDVLARQAGIGRLDALRAMFVGYAAIGLGVWWLYRRLPPGGGDEAAAAGAGAGIGVRADANPEGSVAAGTSSSLSVNGSAAAGASSSSSSSSSASASASVSVSVNGKAAASASVNGRAAANASVSGSAAASASPSTDVAAAPERTAPLGPSRRIVVQLAALFSLDSFAGGLVVNSLLSLWLLQRFGLSLAQAGAFFFWAGLLSAASQLAAPWVAQRIGLLNTMVFTHIPANLCLVAAALAPSLPIALALLLVRSALSQMDVPTRTAFVMAVVTPAERSAAASFTAVPRSLAAALSPTLAGALFAAGWIALPLIGCGVLKIAYDLALWRAMRRHPVDGI